MFKRALFFILVGVTVQSAQTVNETVFTSAATEASTLAATSTTTILDTTTSWPSIAIDIGNLNNTDEFGNVVDGTITTDQNTTHLDPPSVQFFIEVVQNGVIGARFCKRDSDCGSGLTCNLFWNLCSPSNIPAFFSTFESGNCTQDTDCSDMHFCITGQCRFCGPTSCHSNFDCCGTVSSNVTYQCIDLEHVEKHALATQLGRPTVHGAANHNNQHSAEDIESEEVLALGATAQGDQLFHHRRCWAQCAFDEDCQFSGWPLALQGVFKCCNGFCSRKESCVTVPANFIPTTAPVGAKTLAAPKVTKKIRTEKKKKH